MFKIDWSVFATFAAPIGALFVGAGIDRALERRPKLIGYVTHATAVSVPIQNGQPIQVHTHSFVVRNVGRKPAVNIRLGHYLLPSFSVFPAVTYQLNALQGGGQEILFPSLVPEEQITVTYLYFPPLLWSGVNSYTKSDEGFAKIVSVLPTPPKSKLNRWGSRVFAIIGIATVAYALWELIVRVLVWR